MDIQTQLDEWLASNPAAQKYVTALDYLPAGDRPSAEVTHVVRLASVAAPERQLSIGLAVKPQYAAALDVVLAMLATTPA